MTYKNMLYFYERVIVLCAFDPVGQTAFIMTAK